MNVSMENSDVIRSFMLAGLIISSLAAGVALIFIGISRLWGAVLIALGVAALFFFRSYFVKEEFWSSVMAFLLMLIGLLIGGAIAGLFVLVALFFPVV